jgi:hypothetical protein
MRPRVKMSVRPGLRPPRGTRDAPQTDELKKPPPPVGRDGTGPRWKA